jgi:hypothetical protein
MAFSVLHYCDQGIIFDVKVILEIVEQLVVFYTFNAHTVQTKFFDVFLSF